MAREAGKIGEHQIPCTRGLDPALRRNRLLAARAFRPASIPRFAILTGQWDGGEIVSTAGRSLLKPKPKRNKRKASK